MMLQIREWVNLCRINLQKLQYSAVEQWGQRCEQKGGEEDGGL